MTKETTKSITSSLLNYIQSQISNFGIDQETRNALCFRERLNVYSKPVFTKDTGLIGSYCISIESTGSGNQNFLIFVFSSMKINGSFGGSKIISSATEELHCLEEKRNEFIETDRGLLKKNLYISSGENYYSIKSTNDFHNDENKSFDIEYKDDHKIISDGINILLMRYLALTNFNGILTFDFINIDGILIVCNYECFPAKFMKIEDSQLHVYTIRQTFYKHGKLVEENKIFMTKKGKIINFEWINSLYTMKIDPKFDLLTCSANPILIPLREKWHEDLELNSKYKDKKTDEIVKLESYLLVHTEIRNVLADYVQTLLCRKPKDVLQFTLKYFKSMI